MYIPRFMSSSLLYPFFIPRFLFLSLQYPFWSHWFLSLSLPPSFSVFIPSVRTSLTLGFCLYPFFIPWFLSLSPLYPVVSVSIPFLSVSHWHSHTIFRVRKSNSFARFRTWSDTYGILKSQETWGGTAFQSHAGHNMTYEVTWSH